MATSMRAITWLLFITLFGYCFAQKLGTGPFKKNGICKTIICNNMAALKRLKDCVVVLGNLQVLEKTPREEISNVTFPKLREVTGYVVVYRVPHLESLGQLFPNLTRIRGKQLLNNYGLVVHDMENLREIGLYSLLKIDRGGVIVWGAPEICYVDTIDWQVIAPRSRHVLNPTEKYAHCNTACTCNRDPKTNRCWNIRKCQRFLVGPEAEKCNEQCFGCRKTNPDDCSLCRYYTYKGQCVSKCPNGTIVLPDNNYCLTEEECTKLDGWKWSNQCVFECPMDYIKQNMTKTKPATCIPCLNCQKTCDSLVIQTLDTMQAAERCVYINGSLTIHVRYIPEGMEEMRRYLNRIKEVSDFVVIYGSMTITSLDFLVSLRRIKGRTLASGKYSLVICDMVNLQTLFLPNVIKNLKVDRGTLSLYDNPMLCMSKIEKLKQYFPEEPNALDIPPGMNGYSGGCDEVSVDLQIRVQNETSALVMFSPMADPDIHYSLLYVRLPPGVHETFVPETCSEFEWNAVHMPVFFGQVGFIELTSLRPASTYAVCIETYDPAQRNIARSTIVNFTTPVGIPEPPFILELVASSSEVVVVRWVDHKDYSKHITHYELDVHMIEIYTKDVFARDHCRDNEEEPEIDYTRHARVMRPPPEYDRGCESMCGLLSTVTAGAMVEENFDICENIDTACNHHEYDIPGNTTFDKYVRTMVLNIRSKINAFQVAKLAPYRDYRFRLRACVRNKCSRSTRGVVRTLASNEADIPSIVFISANEAGFISVKWKPPAVTNGPVLAYSIQVVPKIKVSNISYLLPQSWCVPANKFSMIVHSEKATKYFIKVCTTTLASSSACTEWATVVVLKESQNNWWWTGVIFGFLLYVASSIVGYFYRLRFSSDYDDDTMLLGENTNRNESDPPTFIMSDFAPLYNIPLRETHLE